MAVHRFAQLILDGKEVPIYGEGNALRDFTFVTDTVSGFLGALEAPLEPGYHVFNLGRGEPVPLLQVIRLLEEELGKEASLRFLPEQPVILSLRAPTSGKRATFSVTGRRYQSRKG